MIRPFTCACLLLAAGAGLYTYQAKHQAELLDREIARVMGLADAARQHAGLLRAEYARFNDPQRLAELAATYLPDMRATAPGQFTNLAELDRRLPPVGPPPSAAPKLAEPPDLAPLAVADPSVPGGSLTAAKPVAIVAAAATPPAARAAQLAQTSPSAGAAAPIWPVASRPVVTKPLTARPAPVSRPDAAGRVAIAAQSRPVVPKTSVAAIRVARPDSFVTPVSAPSEALARLAAAAPSVGRSGLGGGTVSSLGMARMAGSASLYPAALPTR